MYIISITCPGFCLSFFGYHFSLRGVIGRVWISFLSFSIAIISFMCSIICKLQMFISRGQMCDLLYSRRCGYDSPNTYLSKPSITDSHSSLCREAQLSADHLSISLVPAIVTDGPPLSLNQELHTTFVLCSSSHQTYAWCCNINCCRMVFEQCSDQSITHSPKQTCSYTQKHYTSYCM